MNFSFVKPISSLWLDLLLRVQRVENMRQMEFIVVNGVYCPADSKMLE